jgi:hypothetical protein
MARSSNKAALAEIMASEDPPKAFLDASLMIRRAVIDALVVVQVHRAPRGRKAFDQSSVEVTPK